MKGGKGTFYKPNAVKTFFNILRSILSVFVSKKKNTRALLKGPLNPHFQFHVLPDNPLPCVLDSCTTDSVTFPLVLHSQSQKWDRQLLAGPDPVPPKAMGRNPLGSDPRLLAGCGEAGELSCRAQNQQNVARLLQMLISIRSSSSCGMEDTSKSLEANVYMEQGTERQHKRWPQVGRKKRAIL